MIRLFLFVVAITISALVPASADDNVRAVQNKLKAEGFYFGEVNGAFSAELSAAMTRYQIRNGLEVTGQLDEETSKALGAKPAVTTTASPEATPSSETWRRLRKSDKAILTRRSASEATPAAVAAPPAVASTPDAAARAATPAATAAAQDATQTVNTERLRDYVGAFVLAGLDPQVGAELEFFADRVRYYDEGVIGRDAIRQSLQSYNQKWPQRRFWIAGDITAEPQREGQLRVTFPLRYELRRGAERSSGKILKSLVLEAAGDDFQIVAVNERKAQ